MVAFTDLKDAQPQQLRDAATGWKDLADEAMRASEDIHQRGVNAVKWYWLDDVGGQAAKALADLADGFEVASTLCRSVMMVLDGAADAIAITQSCLSGAVDSATAHGLSITSQGTVTAPVGAPQTETDLARSIQNDIDNALRRANEIDNHTADELHKLATHNWNEYPDYTGSVMTEASSTEVQLLVDTLPTTKSEAFVRHWWDSLTPQQQTLLERAVPAQLMGLKGLPAEVYGGHVRPGDYNPTEAAGWARDHGTRQDFDNDLKNNCSNFTSRAMEQGGLKQNDGWNHSEKSWGNYLGDRVTHLGHVTDEQYTGSWSEADQQHDYLLKHGGQQVPTDKANPGDIIYFKQVGDGNPDAGRGEIYHAAMITSVTPDGVIHYTQHTPTNQDVPLQGRIDQLGIHHGNLDYQIVRPPPHW